MEKINIVPKQLININRMWLNVVVLLVSLFTFSVVIYYNVSPWKAKDANTTIITPNIPEIKTIERTVPKYPHCTKNDEYSLTLLINKYVFDVNVCNTTIPPVAVPPPPAPAAPPAATTDNCQQIKTNPSSSTTQKQHTNKDTRDKIIIYIAVALLLTSLGAALLEVWKVFLNNKKEQAKTPTNMNPNSGASPSGLNGGIKVPAKPELTRRCSLADLTVLRHHRRESMMRRDSAMHMSIDNSTNAPGTGNSHRVPLKTMGTVSIRPKLRVD